MTLVFFDRKRDININYYDSLKVEEIKNSFFHFTYAHLNEKEKLKHYYSLTNFSKIDIEYFIKRNESLERKITYLFKELFKD